MASDIFWNAGKANTSFQQDERRSSPVTGSRRKSPGGAGYGGGLLGDDEDVTRFQSSIGYELPTKTYAEGLPPRPTGSGGSVGYDTSSMEDRQYRNNSYDEEYLSSPYTTTTSVSNSTSKPSRNKNHHYHSSVFNDDNDVSKSGFVPSISVHNKGRNNYISQIFPSSDNAAPTHPSKSPGNLSRRNSESSAFIFGGNSDSGMDTPSKSGKRHYHQSNTSSFGSSFLFKEDAMAESNGSSAGRRRASRNSAESSGGNGLDLADSMSHGSAEESRKRNALKNSSLSSGSMADILSPGGTWSDETATLPSSSSRRRSSFGVNNTLKFDDAGDMRACGLSSMELNRDRQGKRPVVGTAQQAAVAASKSISQVFF
jgi:hypothetical protein